MVPNSMTSHVHSFDARPGGEFRVSLTHDAPTGRGKTGARTDTYHGRFVRLVPDTEVVQVIEFETDDPALRGEMTITVTLADACDGGTSLTGVHRNLPPGVAESDNELGWSQSLEKLARLVEDGFPVTNPPLAEAFTYPGVVSAYQHRPPYPDAVFDVLTSLITDTPRTVLDLGAGEGALARPLAGLADQVDALDVSAAMISAGRLRPGGDAPNLRWILGAAETAPLGGPYALVTAGASMHWMQWRQTLGRLAVVLADGAFLAIVGHGHDDDAPWMGELDTIIARHSRSPAYDPCFRLVDALTETGLFETAGHVATAPEPFRQRVVDYVEYLHSTSSLAREWMPAEEAAAFDGAVTGVVAPYQTDGWLDMAVVADVTWGRVLSSRGRADAGC
jgi:SAM-dependent methyltransferase/uncharacterized protein YndB with AHSA1/START domain